MSNNPRRQALAGVSLAATATLAGCLDLSGSPDPRVVELQQRIDPDANSIIDVVVQNDGETGDVVIELYTLDEYENPLDTERQTVGIEEDERNAISFEVSPAEETERFGAEANDA